MPFRELNLDIKKKDKNIGVGIDITQICQCDCPTCFYEKKEGTNEMSFELFQTIVDEAKQNNFQEIYLLGGEPMLHRNLFDLLDYAGEGRFNPLILVTNGLKLSNENVCKEIADRGIMVAVQRHVIGDDDEAEKIQDTLMGRKGTLPIVNKAFDNIERCFDPDKVAVQCCITKPVIESGQIFRVFEYAREHGHEQVMECTKAGNHFLRGNPMDVTLSELLEIYQTFQRIDLEKYPKLAAKILTPQAYGKTCHMPETGVHVLINGDVIPCVGQHYKLGNLAEGDRLADILKSEERKFFQYPEERIEGHCKECGYLPDCTGGCRGDAYEITGCFNASAVQCPQIAERGEELSLRAFVPKSCSGCDMEKDPLCHVREDIKPALKQYLKENFNG